MILRSEYAFRLLVKGAAKPMKERLGDKPASAAKIRAVRVQRRLQEILSLRPEAKARQRHDPLWSSTAAA